MCYYAVWEDRVCSSVYCQLCIGMARANLQLKGMGNVFLLFADGQYIVEDYEQESVVGQIGTEDAGTNSLGQS